MLIDDLAHETLSVSPGTVVLEVTAWPMVIVIPGIP
jgi:hypothetical protein